MRARVVSATTTVVMLMIVFSGCGGSRLTDETWVFDSPDASSRKVLDITDCSPLGSSPGYVWGQVWNASAAQYKVIVYIYVNGVWWPKPYFASPNTQIKPDGTWKCLITTGGYDPQATMIFCGLAPVGYNQPLTSLPGRLLPKSVYDHCVSWMEWTRTNKGKRFRTLWFPWTNGYEWEVKNGTNMGPGPNNFSWSNWVVWLDEQWKLHMRIVNRRIGGQRAWWCSEIINRSYLGYGTYRWVLDQGLESLGSNAVLGLFTWDDNAPPFYREIDIEFGLLDHPNYNAQYVLQPWDQPGQRKVWRMPATGVSTHQFKWKSDRLVFESYQGESSSGPLLKQWSPTGTCAVPTPGKAQARTNLWLYKPWVPPSVTPHVVIKRFTHER